MANGYCIEQHQCGVQISALFIQHLTRANSLISLSLTFHRLKIGKVRFHFPLAVMVKRFQM
jgi:hypothetical protein